MRFALPALPPRLAGVALAVLHFCVGLVVTLDPASAHDEGLLMFGFARALGEAFAPCFFFLKSKPALALFYWPVASLGLRPYLIAHLAVASAAIGLVYATARSLGHARPWLPALIVALSPTFTWSGMTGVSNSDGVAGIALFLYLFEARKSLFAAGLVLGLLPWVRYECALFSVVMAPWALARTRSRELLFGLLLWPVLYLGAGALYHQDALWPLHFRPNVSDLSSGNEAWLGEIARHSPKTAFFALAAVSPAVFLLGLVRPLRLGGLERALGVFAVGFFGLFLASHLAPGKLGPAFIFGFSPRYAVAPLVAVALLVSRAIEVLEVSEASEVKEAKAGAGSHLRDTLAAAALLGVGYLVRAFTVVPLWGAAATGALVAAARAGARRIGLAVVLGLLLLLPLRIREDLRAEMPLTDPTLEPMAAWIEANPDLIKGEIFTNQQLLGRYLDLRGSPSSARPRVRFMLAVDHHFELVHLSNPANGQRAAVLDAIPRAVFGDVVLPEALDPAKTPPGTVFILVDDSRTKKILPPEMWGKRLRVLHEAEGFSVREVTVPLGEGGSPRL
jgi:hypothetical protein